MMDLDETGSEEVQGHCSSKYGIGKLFLGRGGVIGEPNSCAGPFSLKTYLNS
jgi:hypothetical protein